MDFKDLLQILEQSPLWFKANLVIVQAATLYTAFKVLLPFFRQSVRRAKMCWCYLAPADRMIWFLYKPTIKMINKPTISIANIAGDIERRKITTIINLQFKGNDRKSSDITLEDLRMSIWQGRGKRRMKIILHHTFQAYSDKVFKLTKECVSKEIELEGFININIPESDIDFNKPYTWKVEGIRGKVFGTHSKFLRSFKVRVS